MASSVIFYANSVFVVSRVTDAESASCWLPLDMDRFMVNPNARSVTADWPAIRNELRGIAGFRPKYAEMRIVPVAVAGSRALICMQYTLEKPLLADVMHVFVVKTTAARHVVHSGRVHAEDYTRSHFDAYRTLRALVGTDVALRIAASMPATRASKTPCDLEDIDEYLEFVRDAEVLVR